MKLSKNNKRDNTDSDYKLVGDFEVKIINAQSQGKERKPFLDDLTSLERYHLYDPDEILTLEDVLSRFEKTKEEKSLYKNSMNGYINQGGFVMTYNNNKQILKPYIL